LILIMDVTDHNRAADRLRGCILAERQGGSGLVYV
jgi:hypothetical protein